MLMLTTNIRTIIDDQLQVFFSTNKFSDYNFDKRKENCTCFREDNEFIDKLTFGYEQRTHQVIGSIRIARKVKVIESYWENFDEYLLGKKPKFNLTTSSHPFSKDKLLYGLKVDLYQEKELVIQQIMNFFERVYNYIDVDIAQKSDIKKLNNALNNPFDKNVKMHKNKIKKLIVAKLAKDDNYDKIYEYVIQFFNSIRDNYEEKYAKEATRYLEVIKIVKQRLDSDLCDYE